MICDVGLARGGNAVVPISAAPRRGAVAAHGGLLGVSPLPVLGLAEVGSPCWWLLAQLSGVLWSSTGVTVRSPCCVPRLWAQTTRGSPERADNNRNKACIEDSKKCSCAEASV